MNDRNKVIEKCKKLLALAEGTHSVNEAETALNIMKQIAAKNAIRVNPKTLERVENHINKLRGITAPEPKATRPTSTEPKSAKKTTRKSGKQSLASYIRELISKGYSNESIILLISQVHGLMKDDAYVNWYRSEMKRKGK